jgi:hypothetical protein
MTWSYGMSREVILTGFIAMDGFWMIIWQEILWAMENAGYGYYEPF